MKKLYFLGAAANYSRKQRLAHTFCIGRQKDVDKLKDFLTQKYDGKRTIVTKNGRSALTLALKATLPKGSRVIVNGFTCYAVYEAVIAADMIPVFADINKNTLNFDLNTIKAALSAGPAAEAEFSAGPAAEAALSAGPAAEVSPTLDGARAGVPPSASPADDKSASPASPADDKSASPAGPTADVAPRGIVIQNTLGNVVDIAEIEKFATKNNITIIEDLAHSAGLKYEDGREVGTVGAATALSFGKDKSIDTISGGAVVFRADSPRFAEPRLRPRFSDHFRERFYPLFGAISRGLTHIHLGGVFMKFLVATHQVQKSADNKLETNRKISKFEAKMALKQLRDLSPEAKIREFFLVKNRGELLSKLRAAGYYFDGFWYEKPVSPARYYEKVGFPEDLCPVAVEIASKIINIPTYYTEKQLAPALKIINKYVERD